MSSPRPRPRSAKPSPRSRSSKPNTEPAELFAEVDARRKRRPRRGVRIAGLLLGGLVALALIATVVWFTTASWRADRAQEFDTEARTALAEGNEGLAYSREQLAYAISPDSDRALALGSLAYLRGDYTASLNYFREAEGEIAALGTAAAAAQVDPDAYEEARDALGEPTDEVVRLGLGHAAVDAADFETAGRFVPAGDAMNEAYPRALALATKDPDRAAQIVAATDAQTTQLTHPDPVVAAFLGELTTVPDNADQEIRRTLRQIAVSENDLSRKVLLGTLLLNLDESNAALVIGRETSEQQPEYRDAWTLRAAAALALDEVGEAAQATGIAAELDPAHGYTWYLKSEIEAANGNEKQADEFKRRAELLGYKAP